MPPTMIRELREKAAAARQRRDYHHRQFNQALANLKTLGSHCPGVSCPRVQAAGLVLAKATRSEVHAPFMTFADAIRDHARDLPKNSRGDGVKRLANRAVGYMRELAHHVDREAAAQRELQLFQYTLETIEAGTQAAKDSEASETASARWAK
ncbi:hypothetical protein [Billgrantia montanilacus]|uniref:Uncharacterized protein n=1 Tax=Billgrantia montanilacus TaxID=2282305 RepID=A0A368U0G0_9GAMM|nr:hypothetical protein [Halomonas montanilacus]RCV90498.1 hypothetical protein DU505_06060 [Halomonas montanilacus]